MRHWGRRLLELERGLDCVSSRGFHEVYQAATEKFSTRLSRYSEWRDVVVTCIIIQVQAEVDGGGRSLIWIGTQKWDDGFLDRAGLDWTGRTWPDGL